jgi:hypothetical protein
MEWYELAAMAIYAQAFIWYGRLSYVQGVLDHRHAPDSPSVRKVIGEESGMRGELVPVRINGRGDSRRAR